MKLKNINRYFVNDVEFACDQILSKHYGNWANSIFYKYYMQKFNIMEDKVFEFLRDCFIFNDRWKECIIYKKD